MIENTGTGQVYIALGPTDLRKSIDGLALLVQLSFKLDPFSTNLFVFCNRKKDKLKILCWEHNGFWLHYRRLEKGKFHWPEQGVNKVTSISKRELRWLLDGLPFKRQLGHKEVLARTII